MTKVRNIIRHWATIYLARLVKCNFQGDQFFFRFQGQESHFAEKKNYPNLLIFLRYLRMFSYVFDFLFRSLHRFAKKFSPIILIKFWKVYSC